MKQAPRKDIFSRMAAQQMPIRVQIEITRRCNLDCAHCMIVHSRGADSAPCLSLDELRSLFEQLRRAGTFHINITGGEPLVRPDALEVLQAAFDAPFLVTLQTNGVLLEQAHVDLLASHASQVRQVALSLYAMDPAVHEAVTRVPGSHARTLRAIHMLREAGIPVVVLMAITTINAAAFPAVESFCAEQGLTFQFNALILPQDDGGLDPVALRLDEKLLCRMPRPWETFMDESRVPEPESLQPDSQLTGWCTMGSATCYITAAGDVRPCSMVNLPAGNVRTQTFQDIWEHADVFRRLRAMRLRDFECFSCKHFPVCNPCPGLAFLEHGDFTLPAREVCRINSVFLNKTEVNP